MIERFGVHGAAPTLLLGAVLASLPTPAPADGVNIARDAETEALIQDYARPLFKAAGISASNIQILLIPDPTFNAFVADSSHMFLNTGTLIKAKTPNEVIGVIAHETAHLAHNDLARLRQKMEDAKIGAMIAAIAGIGAAVAGATSGVNGLGQAGVGVIAGGMQVAQRSVLMYQRAQEAAADRSAVDYLNATGQSPAGMLAVLKRLANDTLLSSSDADPYIQSHPLAADRVITLENLVAKSKYGDRADPPALQQRHDLVRAKIAAFTMSPTQVGRLYPNSDNSLPARYARAVVAYQTMGVAPTVKLIDGLLASSPDNPYFLELKGQTYLEGGKPNEAVPPLRKAVSLAPSSGLIRVLFGQALVATGNKALLGEAIEDLTVGLQTDPDLPVGYRALGRAYAMKGDITMAELATAEGLFANGEIEEAQAHAERAQAKLKVGTRAWLRADDIVSYKPPVKH